MATDKQILGNWGEDLVARECGCPRCKRSGTLKKLRQGFRCADVICDFCGYLAQVKTAHCADEAILPDMVQGAAWKPQHERMEAGIYFPLFLVLRRRGTAAKAIYYLAADLQEPAMFLKRNPLRETARRAGWVGFNYDLKAVKDRFVRLV